MYVTGIQTWGWAVEEKEEERQSSESLFIVLPECLCRRIEICLHPSSHDIDLCLRKKIFRLTLGTEKECLFLTSTLKETERHCKRKMKIPELGIRRSSSNFSMIFSMGKSHYLYLLYFLLYKMCG